MVPDFRKSGTGDRRRDPSVVLDLTPAVCTAGDVH